MKPKPYIRKTKNPDVLLFYGESKEILLFRVGTLSWESYNFDKQGSDFNGGLKFMGCELTPSKRIFLSGGCHWKSNKPVSTMYELKFSQFNQSIK
jgi:hypothetical protein